MSEHEGFMVPLIEAAYFEVPIVAYAAGAVPETLAGQGVLLPDTDIEATAAVWDRVLGDPAMHKQLVSGQKQILQKFDHARVKATLTDYLQRVIG
jgi:glycosyltransferase involved in cell wall biosynthesis